jgi:plastocyanin
MRHVLRPARVLAWIALCGGLIAGCGNTTAPSVANTTNNAPSTVTIPAGQDIFDPYILPVQPGETITWHNADSVAHTIVTTPLSSTFLNPQAFNLTVGPGQDATVTLTQPGVYQYYDNTQADWAPAYERPRAHQGVPHYPMSMEGIIWVQGSIPGLPMAVQNTVVHLKDQIATFVVAVHTGGTVSWTNHDTDAHFFQTVLGWDPPINPREVGIDNLLGEDAMPPNGQTRTITFTTPGLYYYFCFTHATVNPVLLRVYARQIASEYPMSMDGLVLVTN